MRNEEWSEPPAETTAFSVFNVLFHTLQMLKTAVTPSGSIKWLYFRIFVVAIDHGSRSSNSVIYLYNVCSLQKAGCVFYMW